MKRFTRLMTFILVLSFILAPFGQIFTSEVEAAEVNSNTPSQQLQKNLEYIVKTVKNPMFGTLGGEWTIISLARAGYKVPEGYYDIYYNNVTSQVKKLIQNEANKGHLDARKGTENSRLIMGLTALGKDVTNVAEYNVLKSLGDYDHMIWQGINGPIFALIALDTHNYEIPLVEEGKNQSTRELFVNFILEKEIKKGTNDAGGWALFGSTPDPDITAMAIQALTPYYKTREDVKVAVDRSINILSKIQKEDGGYGAWGGPNSESVGQVIVALSGLGIDPHKDERFIKNGNSALDNLMTFASPEGGFKHVKSSKVDAMATDQGTYALVAYDRFIKGQNSLYDMSDVKLENSPVEPEIPETPEEPENPGELEEKYEILEGNKEEVKVDGKTGYRIVSNGDYDKFEELRINGKVVDKKYYSIEEGSTIINISAEYLKELESGDYDVELVYEDGIAKAQISLVNNILDEDQDSKDEEDSNTEEDQDNNEDNQEDEITEENEESSATKENQEDVKNKEDKKNDKEEEKVLPKTGSSPLILTTVLGIILLALGLFFTRKTTIK